MTDEQRRAIQNNLVALRAKVDNQVLIKNYNLGTFIEDMDVTIQNLILYMVKQNDFNVFLAYMVEYIWKIIQVKLAFMVRQLNYKVASD